jgi:hypothetical protein
MLGDLTEGSDQAGIVPTAVDHIFTFINSQHANVPIDEPNAPPVVDAPSALGQLTYLVSLSFLEIYKSVAPMQCTGCIDQAHSLLTLRRKHAVSCSSS